MKIDFSQEILSIDGKPTPLNDDHPSSTLRDICVTALDRPRDPNERLEAEEKIKRARLAERIYRAKEPINLMAEEIALLKRLISDIFLSNWTVYQASKLLDPPADQA